MILLTSPVVEKIAVGILEDPGKRREKIVRITNAAWAGVTPPPDHLRTAVDTGAVLVYEDTAR
jgi:hypothetical protein